MSKMRMALLMLVLLLLPVLQLAAAPQGVKRFAVVVGSNDGGRNRVKLRYAESDARAVVDVFEELGGLERSDRVLLLEPTVSELQASLEELARTIDRSAGRYKRTEVLFYYSGHSDEKGLLLGQERLEYLHLRSALKQIKSDVHLAVLDSCASGAFTRIKGGKRQPPFLVDESSSVKGHAFLTSSSADEAAQESDAIGGSYFTHYFVSALRGAGDRTRDKRVTLNEAYQFAFHETLALTEQTLSGAQHAAYDIQLAGAGDLVLTDLSAAGSVLTLDADVLGRVFVRNSQGQLLVELNKQQLKPVNISLPPGQYILTLDANEKLLRQKKVIQKNQTVKVDLSGFMAINRIATVARGGKLDDIGQYNADDYTDIRFKVGLLPDLSIRSDDLNGKKENVKVDLNLFAGVTDRVSSVAIGYFVSIGREDVIGGQGAGISAIVGNDLIGGHGSGVFSMVKGDMLGGQGTGAVSLIKGNAKGGQGAGAVSIVQGRLEGGQGAGVVSLVKDGLQGGQGAGAVAIVTGDVTGGQGAGGVAIINGDLRGGQGAGAVSIVRGNVHGGQGAGVVTIATGNVKGGQGAGVVNIAAKTVEGIQGAGILNVAKIANSGQFGMVNVAAENNGFAFGLINIAGNGRISPGVAFDESGYSRFYLKSGVKSFFNRLDISHQRLSILDYYRVGWGFGWQKRISRRLSIDSDMFYARTLAYNPDLPEELPDVPDSSYFSIGISPVFNAVSKLNISMRLSINMEFGKNIDAVPGDYYAGNLTAYRENSETKLWPGFMLGVEL